jgi:hypothetical protein
MIDENFRKHIIKKESYNLCKTHFLYSIFKQLVYMLINLFDSLIFLVIFAFTDS